MSKGQLTITAEEARALCGEAKFAEHIPHIQSRIVCAAERGESFIDLGLWTASSKYLQKRLEDNGFAVVATEERAINSANATRLKVSW